MTTTYLRGLRGIDPQDALLIIPCSKQKHLGGQASTGSSFPWASSLLSARQAIRASARVDEHMVMPAWLRYCGGFYTAAETGLRDAVASGAPIFILSGGYGLLRAEEPIGHYDRMMRLADWPPGLLEELLAAEARNSRKAAVVAFAAASTEYARLVRRVPWERAGLSAFLVTISGVSGGAMREVPRRLGHAFTCFRLRGPADDYPEGTTVEALT